MHSKVLVPTILIALLAFPSPSPGQSSAESPTPPEAASASEDESSDEPSKRDLFFDPDDGKLDFSRFLAGRKGFLPVGGLITEPAG